MSVEERLAGAGLRLPEVRVPLGAYVPAIRTGSLVYTAGQVSAGAGREYKGKVGAQVTIEEAQEAARAAVLNALAAVKAQVGSLDRVRQVVRLNGFVNSAPGFTRQPEVLNAASSLLAEVFGERGRHTRVAVGVSELPFDFSVEVDLIVEVE